MAIGLRRAAGALIAAGLLLAPAACVHAVDAQAVGSSKHDDIIKILEITDARRNAQIVIDASLPSIIGIIRKANPRIPQSLIDELQKESREEFIKALPEFVEAIVTVYEANYSADEIKQLRAFYESPLGRKITARTPQVLQQTQALGQVWGRQVGERVVARLRQSAKEKGFDL
jgi:hypothetical protein